MTLFRSPSYVASLRDARFWSLDWIKEKGISGPFAYVVLLKAGAGYRWFGQFAASSDAFAARRQLVAEHGTPSFFVRAVRVVPVEECIVVGPGHPESREDLDRFRDALATGDDSLIASDELGSYRQWVSREIASGKIPF
jgi:hypothetical protein